MIFEYGHFVATCTKHYNFYQIQTLNNNSGHKPEPEHTTALLDTLVEKKQLVKLVDDTVNQEEKHGIQVYIGNETQVQSLRDCSIVTATYELKEGGTGTVGIIGPKRMDYRKVVNTLRNLTDDLDEIFNNKS